MLSRSQRSALRDDRPVAMACRIRRIVSRSSSISEIVSLVDVGLNVALLVRAACVTGSVTLGSERDEQDATGHDSMIEPYLA